VGLAGAACSSDCWLSRRSRATRGVDAGRLHRVGPAWWVLISHTGVPPPPYYPPATVVIEQQPPVYVQQPRLLLRRPRRRLRTGITARALRRTTQRAVVSGSVDQSAGEGAVIRRVLILPVVGRSCSPRARRCHRSQRHGAAGTGKNFEQFQSDDAVCRQWAAQQTGTTPNKTATENTVGGAVVGTLVGAALGAAIGAAAGGPATGAAVGAGVGLLEVPPSVRQCAGRVHVRAASLRCRLHAVHVPQG